MLIFLSQQKTTNLSEFLNGEYTLVLSMTVCHISLNQKKIIMYLLCPEFILFNKILKTSKHSGSKLRRF